MATKRNALGRGLNSLISIADIQTAGSSIINEIEISRIEPNPKQPRRSFDEETLSELAASIKELGVVQPLSVRETTLGNYQIIAGERRWRAARMAGLQTVPAYVRSATDSEVTEMALIENIQREDLNAIEVALAFKNLIDTLGLTQERLAERLGKKRTTIANHLRLLRLPAEIQLGLRDHKLDMGHARALLSVNNAKEQLKLYNRILNEDLSVRVVEQMAKKYSEKENSASVKERRDKQQILTSEINTFQNSLRERFNLPVKIIKRNDGKGTVTFTFSDQKQFEDLIGLLNPEI